MTDPVTRHSSESGLEVRTERLDPARAQALHTLFGHPGPPPESGDALHPFWHWAYFWDVAAAPLLGRDGHPAPGRFVPQTGLPRRMWAGGSLRWHSDLIVGEAATHTRTLIEVVHKTGKSGPLAFVAIDHTYKGPNGLAVEERQDLVYRPDHVAGEQPSATPAPAPTDETTSRSHDFDAVALFRYSALTFNGHRIHYDREYAQDVEGYRDLVVHGPILAQLMLDLALSEGQACTRFQFRARAPIFAGEPFETCARPTGTGLSIWTRGSDGRLAMTGDIS